jgi:hypothetical protein
MTGPCQRLAAERAVSKQNTAARPFEEARVAKGAGKAWQRAGERRLPHALPASCVAEKIPGARMSCFGTGQGLGFGEYSIKAPWGDMRSPSQDCQGSPRDALLKLTGNQGFKIIITAFNLYYIFILLNKAL